MIFCMQSSGLRAVSPGLDQLAQARCPELVQAQGVVQDALEAGNSQRRAHDPGAHAKMKQPGRFAGVAVELVQRFFEVAT